MYFDWQPSHETIEKMKKIDAMRRLTPRPTYREISRILKHNTKYVTQLHSWWRKSKGKRTRYV